VKDIQEILQQKESECARVQKEIEALRVVIPLLEGNSQPEVEGRKQPEHSVEAASKAEGTGTDGPTFSAVTQSESSFWKRRR
jgi:hypothetical protein